MVLTSNDDLGDTGGKTGFWLEEFAAPYYEFRDAGAGVVLASPAGGQPPMDPASDRPEAQTPATCRFKQDYSVRVALAHSRRLTDIDPDEFDAVFYPGGHGPLWDLADDSYSVSIIESIYAAGGAVAAVCHAPAVFKNARRLDGRPLVQGRQVTGFSNSEEDATGRAAAVPFRVEDMLRHLGGEYSRADDGQPHVAVDGRLVTGQNPASSALAARELLFRLRARMGMTYIPAGSRDSRTGISAAINKGR